MSVLITHGKKGSSIRECALRERAGEDLVAHRAGLAATKLAGLILQS